MPASLGIYFGGSG